MADWHNQEATDSGVSIKTAVDSRIEYSNWLYWQGVVSPLFLGGEGVRGHASPGNFEISKPYNVIFSILGTKFEDIRACFSFEKMQLSIYQSHNQFLQTMNKWWKLNYILLHVNKFCVNIYRNLWKNDRNIAFTWLKHKVKLVGLYENTSYVFIQILW